jgi:light-regulated signal transduction histidine kinase (bacteriophytochrome)
MFNRLLTAQINTFFGEEKNIQAEIIPFLKSVSDAYDELEKTNKELDQFAYVVSHDLKAPLRAISSLTTWLEEDLANNLNADTKENFLTLKNRVIRMENLINGVLQYSKAAKTTNRETVDTGIMIREIIQSLECPAHIQILTGVNFPVLQTEKIKLEQVFTNLVSNAIKYNNREQGVIKISCADFEEWSQFYIEDNGPGIDKKYHQKIFEIFQTLETVSHPENTGVGLTIVKKIVEENKGKIWVESEIGKGSKFIFIWPKIMSNILINTH